MGLDLNVNLNSGFNLDLDPPQKNGLPERVKYGVNPRKESDERDEGKGKTEKIH